MKIQNRKEFSSVPWFNLCKMAPPYSSQISVYANSFEKLLQDIYPFCILSYFIYLFTFPLPGN